MPLNECPSCVMLTMPPFLRLTFFVYEWLSPSDLPKRGVSIEDTPWQPLTTPGQLSPLNVATLEYSLLSAFKLGRREVSSRNQMARSNL